MIKEIIVVEGRDDIIKVKEAIDATVIATHGYGFGDKFINELKKMSENRGIIILTDPDTAGRLIREKLTKAIPDAKQAYIPQKKALKNGDIGIENAKPRDIKEAIEKAKPVISNPKEEYTNKDLMENRLAGCPGAEERRARLSEILHIGHTNAKELLKRLNTFQIPREEFLNALKRIDNE